MGTYYRLPIVIDPGVLGPYENNELKRSFRYITHQNPPVYIEEIVKFHENLPDIQDNAELHFNNDLFDLDLCYDYTWKIWGYTYIQRKAPFSREVTVLEEGYIGRDDRLHHFMQLCS